MDWVQLMFSILDSKLQRNFEIISGLIGQQILLGILVQIVQEVMALIMSLC